MKTHFALTALVLAAASVPARAAETGSPDANVSSASDAAPSARAWSLKPSLQVAQAFYRVVIPARELSQSVDETLLNAVVDGALRIGGSDWSLGSRTSASVAPLIRGASDIGFLDARLFGDYDAWSGGGWSLSFQLGGSYATTYGTSDFGYANLVGPTAGVSLRKITALGDLASVYLRADFYPRHLTDGRVNAGFSYLFSQTGSERSGFEFSSELGYLGAVVDVPAGTRTEVSSVIASLGVGYRF